MKLKRFYSFILVVVLLFVMTSCLKNEKEEKEPMVVSAIIKSEFMDEDGFSNELISTLENIQEKGDENIVLRFLEVLDDSYNPQVIDEAVNEGAKLVILSGNIDKKGLLDAVEAYPNVYFGILENTVEGKNIQSVIFENSEAAFLAGYGAAMKSKSNSIGFIAVKDRITKDIESYEAYKIGFEAGVKKAKKEANVFEYIIESDGSSSDGYEAVKTLVNDNHVDVVYHKANHLGNSIVEAAEDFEILAIGSEKDQSHLSSKFVLSSTVKNLYQPLHNMIKDAAKGKFKENITVYNLKNGGVDLKDRAGNLGDALTKEIEGLKNDIKNGKILVPKTRDQLNDFVNKL